MFKILYRIIFGIAIILIVISMTEYFQEYQGISLKISVGCLIVLFFLEIIRQPKKKQSRSKYEKKSTLFLKTKSKRTSNFANVKTEPEISNDFITSEKFANSANIKTEPEITTKFNKLKKKLDIENDDSSSDMIESLEIAFKEVSKSKRELENVLIAAEKSKKEAEKAVIEKDNFIANMTHEIRTPMNGIIGMAELLAYRNLPEEEKKYAKVIEESSKHLLNLINDVLDISKMDAEGVVLEHSSFNLYQTGFYASEVFMLEAQKKEIGLAFSYSKNLPTDFVGDKIRINQVLTNLIGNAIKFTKEGDIKVRIEGQKLSNDKYITRIMVSDTGIGIPKDRLEIIFDKFHQADETINREFGGTGLGLSICKRLVEKMDGVIKVESIEGQGTTFFVTLELEVDSFAEDVTVQTQTILQIKPNVLLVEDNKTNQIVAKSMLEQFNSKVTIANNGEEAIKAIQESSYDMIFMDCMMPVMNGLEATRRIRKMEGTITHTPIIAMTAKVMPKDKEKCLNAGMDDYISKPIHYDGIARMLRKHTVFKVPSDVHQRSQNMKLQIINHEHIKKVFLGQKHLIDEMIMIFTSETPQLMTELKNFIEEKRFNKAKFIVHTIKGAAANIGGELLERAARNLEKAISKKQFIKLDNLYNKLNEEYYTITTELNIYE